MIYSVMQRLLNVLANIDFKRALVLLLCFFLAPIYAVDFETADAEFENQESDRDLLEWVSKYEPESRQWPVVDQAYFHHRKGLALELNNDIEGAKEQFKQSISLFKQLDEIDPGLVKSLLDLSYMKYLQTNDVAIYCPERKEAVRLARQIDRPEALAGALVQLAFCYQNGFDDLTQGLSVLEEAAEVVESNDLSHSQLAMIHNATGNLYRKNQVHQQAYNHYKKAHQLWLSLDDTQDIFNMLHNMANEARELGHWENAENHIEGLFLLAEEQPNFEDFEFFAELNAGLLAFDRQNFKQAVDSFESALAIKDTTPEVYFVKMAESQLAVAYFRLGQYDRSFQVANDYLNGMDDVNGNATSQEVVIIQLLAQQKPRQAAHKFWQLLDKSRANNREFVKNAVALQALEFDETVNKLQEQAARHELSIKLLELEQQQKQSRINLLMALIVGLFALVAVVIAWLFYRSKKLYQVRAETDYLTRIANRRHIFKQGRKQLIFCKQQQQDFCIFVIDIDGFKYINDDHGHAVGDVVIKHVVDSMLAVLGEGQMLGRIGGEEFLMLLPDVNKDRARECAETIRQKVAETPVKVDNKKLYMTVSIGVAVNQPPVTVFEQLLQRADEAMYQAKAAGKNRVQTSRPDSSTL